MALPDRPRCSRSRVQRSRGRQGSQLLRRCHCRYLSRQDSEMERSPHREGQPGRQPSGQGDSSGLSLGWKRYDLSYSRIISPRSVPEWNSKVGRKGAAIKWPTGIGQKGNEGVAGMVRQAPNSFGYVELIYAVQNKMAFGAGRNSTGKFVKATHGLVSRLLLRRCKEHARRLPYLNHECSRC